MSNTNTNGSESDEVGDKHNCINEEEFYEGEEVPFHGPMPKKLLHDLKSNRSQFWQRFVCSSSRKYEDDYDVPHASY